jgi:hypothetical protein
MAWTRTDAYELMIGRYTLHYRSASGGGKLTEAGDFGTFIEAQVEAHRWEVSKGWQVWIVQFGRFVAVNEETGEVERS